MKNSGGWAFLARGNRMKKGPSAPTMLPYGRIFDAVSVSIVLRIIGAVVKRHHITMAL